MYNDEEFRKEYELNNLNKKIHGCTQTPHFL